MVFRHFRLKFYFVFNDRQIVLLAFKTKIIFDLRNFFVFLDLSLSMKLKTTLNGDKKRTFSIAFIVVRCFDVLKKTMKTQNMERSEKINLNFYFNFHLSFEKRT